MFWALLDDDVFEILKQALALFNLPVVIALVNRDEKRLMVAIERIQNWIGGALHRWLNFLRRRFVPGAIIVVGSKIAFQ